MTNSRDDLKERILAAIDEHRELIFEVGDRIHAQPEIKWEEHFAAELLTQVYTDHGFEVAAGVSDMPTAFTVRLVGRSERPAIGFIAEYDALPDLGHGCGHNLIAASTVAAALGLKAVLSEIEGSIVVFGTPAEEGGAGKLPMITDGLFQQVDAVLMIHHGGDRTSAPAVEGAGRCLAVAQRQFEFFGKTAHAAVDPWRGANALNGVIHTFTGIDALRQHVRSHVRIHGIITHGGDAPNVVPRYAAAEFLVRAPTRSEVAEVTAKVGQIAQGAALMTGTEVKISKPGPFYEEKIPNYTLGRLFNENLGHMGLTLAPQETDVGMYSTDFGNVSQVVPACGCNFAISDESIPGHSPDVVAASASELGKGNMLKASKAMALTALELLIEPELLAQARAEYEERIP